MHGMDVPQFGNHSALEGHKSNFQFVIKYIYIYIYVCVCVCVCVYACIYMGFPGD